MATARAWRRAPPPPPACARALRTHPQPAPSPDGAVGAGLGFAAAYPKPFARRDPNHAEPACLGARWQVTDASLLPRDRAPLAGANRCRVHRPGRGMAARALGQHGGWLLALPPIMVRKLRRHRLLLEHDVLHVRWGKLSDTLPSPHHERRHVRGRPGDTQPRRLLGGDRLRECGHWDGRIWDGEHRRLLILSQGVLLRLLQRRLRLLLRQLQHSRKRNRHGHRHWKRPVRPLPLRKSGPHRARFHVHRGVWGSRVVGHRRTCG